MRLSVDILDHYIPLLHWQYVQVLQGLFDIEQDVLGCIILHLLVSQVALLEVVETNRSGYFNQVDQPIPELVEQGLQGLLVFGLDEYWKVLAVERKD